MYFFKIIPVWKSMIFLPEKWHLSHAVQNGSIKNLPSSKYHVFFRAVPKTWRWKFFILGCFSLVPEKSHVDLKKTMFFWDGMNLGRWGLWGIALAPNWTEEKKRCIKETTWNFFQTHLYHWNEQSQRTRRENGMRTSNGQGIAFERPSQRTLQSNWLCTLQSRIDCWPKSSHPVVMKFRRERRKIRGKKKGRIFGQF